MSIEASLIIMQNYVRVSKCPHWDNARSYHDMKLAAAVCILTHYMEVTWTLKHIISPAIWLFVYQLVPANDREQQTSSLLALVKGLHQWPVDSTHKGPVMQQTFPCHDVIMSDMFLTWRQLTHTWNFGHCFHLQPMRPAILINRENQGYPINGTKSEHFNRVIHKAVSTAYRYNTVAACGNF